MKDLKLVLKKKWFDMIASGEKKEEYRDVKPYYSSRIQDRPTIVTFYLGYAKGRPSMTFEIEIIIIGSGRHDWGAEPGRLYYVIRLGRRLR